MDNDTWIISYVSLHLISSYIDIVFDMYWKITFILMTEFKTDHIVFGKKYVIQKMKIICDLNFVDLVTKFCIGKDKSLNWREWSWEWSLPSMILCRHISHNVQPPQKRWVKAQSTEVHKQSRIPWWHWEIWLRSLCSFLLDRTRLRA